MAVGIFNNEWLGQNEQRSYPLTDACSKQDQTATITIPDSFLVGLILSVTAGEAIEVDKFYLQSLLLTPIGYNVGIGYDDGTDSPPLVAVATLATSTHVEGNSYTLSGTGDFLDSVGHVSIGSLVDIATLPPGSYTFNPADAAIETDCIRPLVQGVSAIYVTNGNDTYGPLTGDVELVANTNMQLVVDLSSPSQPKVIFNAVSAVGFTESCSCVGTPTAAPCITTIDGVGPDSSGNFQLEAGPCISISDITNGLSLTDTCSTPCCGCAMLDALQTQLNTMGNQVLTLQNFVNTINANQTQFSTSVLGSRLGDA